MSRLCIFAHWDSKAEIKRYIVYYLAKLREECDQITFVSTSRLPEAELDKVRPFCAEVLLKENVGLDFGMWKHAIERTDLSKWEELVLTNSSVFGPIFPLARTFERLAEQPDVDFWGMTENVEIAWHLQSYFLVFRSRALHSDRFRQFWQAVLPYRDKDQIIRTYEVGLTFWFTEGGFRPGALVPISALPPIPLTDRLLRGRKRANPTCYYPTALIELGMPLVKIELLRDNPAEVSVRPVYEAMERTGYDMSLVEIDPR